MFFVILYLIEDLVKDFVVPFWWIAVLVKKEEQFLIKFCSDIAVSQPIGK